MVELLEDSEEGFLAEALTTSFGSGKTEGEPELRVGVNEQGEKQVEAREFLYRRLGPHSAGLGCWKG